MITITSKFFSPAVLLFTALIIGFIIATQIRSFRLVEETFLRDRNPNIFREMQILKSVTDKLRKEKEELELKKASGEKLASYRLLSGEVPVTGSGVRIVVPKVVSVTWFTDITNELMTAGAEAVAINGERIGPRQAGFRSIGDTTLLLGDRVLHPSFRLEAIGDKKVLYEALLQPGSTLHRLQDFLKNEEIMLSQEESLLFKKIP